MSTFVKEHDADSPLPAPASFDLDQWLAGAMRAVKHVTVYGKAGLQGEIDELDDRLRDVDEDEKVEIAREIERLQDEMRASALSFKLTSVPSERITALTKRHKGDEDMQMAAMLAEQCLSPAGMTPEKMLAVRDAIGEGYFLQTIVAAASQAQQGLGVTVPFSSAASRALSR